MALVATDTEHLYPVQKSRHIFTRRFFSFLPSALTFIHSFISLSLYFVYSFISLFHYSLKIFIHFRSVMEIEMCNILWDRTHRFLKVGSALRLIIYHARLRIPRTSLLPYFRPLFCVPRA